MSVTVYLADGTYRSEEVTMYGSWAILTGDVEYSDDGEQTWDEIPGASVTLPSHRVSHVYAEVDDS